MKRITNAVLFFIFISNILTAQNHLPTFKYLNVSPHTVNNDESIDININAYDSIYGVRDVAVSIYDPQNQEVYQVVGTSNDYLGNNLYAMEYHISKWAASGVYKLKDIVIINNADGIFYKLTDIDSFTVVSSTPDVTPPTISNVIVYPTTLNISDTLTCEFEARDDVSGLAFVWEYLYDPTNQISVMRNNYFNAIESLGNNRYRLKEVIPATAIKGNWHLELGIRDNADNGFQYVDTTKIFVNGIYKDFTPPTIRSVKVFPDTITSSDTLHIIFEAEDTESGINFSSQNYSIIELINEAGNYWYPGNTFINSVLKKIGQNKYIITMPYSVFTEDIKNEKLFVRIWLWDNADNGTRYDDTTKIFIPCYVNLSTHSVLFPKDGGTERVYESGTWGWSISCDADWLTVSRNNDEIIILAKTNPTDTVRYANVIVSASGVADQIIKVIQGLYPTGTNEVGGSSVSVFPNPVSKTLYLNGLTGMSTVSVFDLNGKIVLKPQITKGRIDVSNLENGIYLIKFSGRKGEFITKFIKQ